MSSKFRIYFPNSWSKKLSEKSFVEDLFGFKINIFTLQHQLRRIAFKVPLKPQTFIIGDENLEFRIELGLLGSSAPIDINLLITASG